MRSTLTIAALLAGCTTFEDPTIVLDLRVLAMTADVPDQIVDVDLTMPMPAEILEQLQPTNVCALVADPAQQRSLRWSMTLCLLDDEGRCDRTLPFVDLGSGVISDPETSPAAQRPCGIIEPAAYGVKILAMLRSAVEANPVQALGGIDYTVVFTVGAVEDRSTDVYATKHLRVSPRIPADRAPNYNPRFDYVDAALAGGRMVILPGVNGLSGRCAELGELEIPAIAPGARLTLFPIEPMGTREDYVVPTLDGKTAMLTETVTYQWFATYGAWSDEFTGGGHDVLGNQSLLGSDWLAPAGLSGPVSLWMIQRDERYGVQFFETCVKVTR
ncbi:MAG: hypothetical protein H0T42_02100 [Deltaproteobacteria bacterium]|nr:hypothetical protein [Deltaproteobacteria bacterium]